MTMVAGVVALVLAVAVAIVGLFRFGRDLEANLWAGVAGLFLDIAVAALVINVLTRIEIRRRWHASYHALSGRFAACYVAAMRLFYIRIGPSVREANESRMPEFIEIFKLHLDDLRSNLEAFATLLEPDTYAECRAIEQRLWRLLIQIQLDVSIAHDRDVNIMRAVGRHISGFIRRHDFEKYDETLRAVSREMTDIPLSRAEHLCSAVVAEKAWGYRLTTQTRVNCALPELSGVSSIVQDYRGRHDLPYFLIDIVILNQALGGEESASASAGSGSGF
ncbi:hypothetical protein [Actinomycetospora sp. TBRC 11914]|uniref:hypothetical protein n=1 Tax=Actinomycetospora sp. TBRC 11914 TaxID=2729387 RepID=UPI00145CBB03|nr:hypothetical protein [Actinomycetospora sp. TBRC 11914]NMO88658.1 hypothetical protein [Actinomycetospora sp. TBRC 11914]